MAKDRSSAEHAEKKEKKHKEKHAEENGVKKPKRDKKEKKSRKSTDGVQAEIGQADVTTKLLNTLEKAKPGSVVVGADGVVVKVVDDDKENDAMEVDGEDKSEVKVQKELLLGAMVPFANPLADEKTMKKVLKGVKRAAKHKTLKRGVKEVVKSLRKSSTTTGNSSSQPPAIVILAADISPFDVISHIPVLCEDHNVPYIYVPSRAELGAAGSTKRPTSVVMITPQGPKKKAGEAAGEEKEKEDWSEVYGDLAKVVVKAGRDVKV